MHPLGGYLGDVFYRRFGVPGKIYLTLACGIVQSAIFLALGLYIDSGKRSDLATAMVVLALFNEMGNGANFALIPHYDACLCLSEL